MPLNIKLLPPTKVTLPIAPLKYQRKICQFERRYLAKGGVHEYLVTTSSLRYLVREFCYFRCHGWCLESNEPQTIHYCMWEGRSYAISTLVGWGNRKHKNFKRIDRICLVEVEDRKYS
ncbi:hypothetical protein RI845_13540 [Thalassotalea nanhaiensis]|uniref:Uncharacterized protein n=1 Tax=Thalassotalea nanhaiensis TaxID=3065648 RepID=A0ABY9TGH8_9GAMM|nr:hypothetical protein RI845_13540 [Colwelliaceae bacterium SQ345]